MKVVILMFSLAMVLAACSPGTQAAPAPPAQATATPAVEEAPGDTPAPAPTSAPPTDAPAATPLGQLFRDDFEQRFGPGWEWENEDVRRWRITEDGWLQITGGDSALLAEGTQSNVLWRDLPEGDFQITTRVRADPTENFQQATIYIYEDADNYVAINRGYCAPCLPGGNAIYMEFKIGGDSGSYNYPTTATDVWLRLVSEGDQLSGWYSPDGDNWNRLGRFGNYFTFNRVGLGVSNVDRNGSIDADLVGEFDFFEIALP